VPVTRQLLERGFHVLCEKPAARYAHEVDELIVCAAKHNRMYAIFQQSRLTLYFQKIVEVVNSGDLGRLVQVKIRFNGFARRWDWQTLQRFNGGSLRNTGPHPLDQALHLLQTDDLPHIYCRMERVNSFGDAEDFVKLILSAPDRPVIDLEISSCSAYPSSLYEIQGSRGGLRATTTSVDWRYFDERLAPAQTLQIEPLQKPDGSPAYCSEILPWVEKHWQQDDGEDTFVGATSRLYANLYEHLTAGEPLLITPRQVRQQIAVIEECHRQNPLPAMQADL
jgi:predicted dehydrogenase